jgi:starch synthase
MRVLFAVVEMSPLAKVGGLADVAGSLPKALVQHGHDVRVMLPLHAGIDTAAYGFRRILADVPVQTPRGPEQVAVWQGTVHGVTTYLVEAAELFERPHIYGEPDDTQRFLFFSDAVLAVTPKLDWMPEVLHLHDWHLAFALVRLAAAPGHPMARCAALYTIHNLALRGDFDETFVEANDLRLPRVEGMRPQELRNGMALGIVCADVISTVSETYAKEILTPEYGAGLDPLLRRRAADLFGIVNGIDPEEFNPAADPHIAARYSAADPSPKAVNKAALQREIGLPEEPGVTLAGVANRLFWQKGMDIAAAGVAELLQRTPMQLVLLGTGEPVYEEQLKELEARFPRYVRVVLDFNLALGQRIYAGSDLFLMPSRYEPCGLGQMIAMRYGSVPVVRRTGGLTDTVPDDDAHPGAGTGFAFVPPDGPALAEALGRAIHAYSDRERWRGIVHRGMTRDFSWREAAPKYVALYDRAVAGHRAAEGVRR